MNRYVTSISTCVTNLHTLLKEAGSFFKYLGEPYGVLKKNVFIYLPIHLMVYFAAKIDPFINM